ESGILMGVHPAGFLEGWVFGDFQSPRLSPDEPSIQPIEASQLACIYLVDVVATVALIPELKGTELE
ncbi:hypothetical protein, partial [Burkholderia cepacia]|uniref:hypothetical protein n=1 Tax=Burkholderia cepacia TaxID=292 RepID=UPI003C7A7035